MHMFKSLAVALAAFGTAVFASDAQLAAEIKQITDLAAAIDAHQGAGVQARAAPSDNAALSAEIKQITDLAAAIDAAHANVQARAAGPSQAEIDALARQINAQSAPAAHLARRADSGMPSRAEIDALAKQINQLSARADEHDALARRANGMPSRAEIDELSRQISQIARMPAQRRDLPPRLAARADQALMARGIGDFFKNAFKTVTGFIGGLFGGGR